MYEGPLFIDFRLPAAWRIQNEHPGEPVRPAQVVIDDVGRMATAEAGQRTPAKRAPLFTVSNHTPACGEPPVVADDAPGTYVGYFANEYDEQAVDTSDDETG